jgi:predicted Zn-ribbon and HTH transcriptional regulator
MSIAMDHHESDERQPETRVWNGLRAAVFPYRFECRTCGYEPLTALAPPPRCPKCFAGGWERFALPRSLLTNTDHYAGAAQAT